jgi:hypothetical protein
MRNCKDRPLSTTINRINCSLIITSNIVTKQQYVRNIVTKQQYVRYTSAQSSSYKRVTEKPLIWPPNSQCVWMPQNMSVLLINTDAKTDNTHRLPGMSAENEIIPRHVMRYGQ